jgi:hypothetical protein
MPSPLGHALAAAAAGWIAAPPDDRSPAGMARAGALFAVLGAVPDVDLLFNWHQGPTHSLGAAVVAGLVAGAITRRARVGAAAWCAYASHVLLDWLGADTAPPFGVMALWPVSHDYYLSRLSVFAGVLRHYRPGFWSFNLKAVAREVVILAPIAWGVFLMRTRVSRRRI